MADLFQVRPWIYWSDLLVTVAAGYSAAAVYLAAQPWSLVQWISFAVCGFALFRAGSFVHEIAPAK